MHFNNFALKLASLVGLATFASTQRCSEVSVLEVSKFLRPPWPPATCSFTVAANLTCAIAKGTPPPPPTYLDYYIEVLESNNGHEAPMLFARWTYNATLPAVDTFMTTAGSVGGVSEGITITGISAAGNVGPLP
ncbi:hypothetical protein C8J57DRAFT_1538694 [Mycena rebaudengoi]|nr:hypothetical protein C8J57DRAFT_1538694 [Mycena rebaudengoi]